VLRKTFTSVRYGNSANSNSKKEERKKLRHIASFKATINNNNTITTIIIIQKPVYSFTSVKHALQSIFYH